MRPPAPLEHAERNPVYYMGVDSPNAISVLDPNGKCIFCKSFKKGLAKTKAATHDERQKAQVVLLVNAACCAIAEDHHPNGTLFELDVCIEGAGGNYGPKLRFDTGWIVGRWAGFIEGLLDSLTKGCARIVYAAPTKSGWHKVLAGLPCGRREQCKASALLYARNVFTDQDWTGPEVEDRADAMCLAVYQYQRSNR